MPRSPDLRAVGGLAGLLVGLPFALAACGDAGPGVGWTTAVDTLPNGATHVVHDPPPTEVAAWRLEEVLRVGTIDGSGPHSFGQVRGLVVLPDSRFAVLDHATQEIRVFSAKGEYLATHGRKGSGPGEFESAYGLMLDSGGRIWVPDHASARMSVVDPDDGFLWSAPLRVMSYGFTWSGAMMADGHVWEPSITLGPPRANVMMVFDRDAVPVDSLPLPPDPDVDPEDPPGAFRVRSPDGRSGATFGIPFFPQGEMRIDPAGAVWSIAYGDADYRIARWLPGGDTTLVLEVGRPPIDVPATERDSVISALQEALLRFGSARQDWSKVPTMRPAVDGMFVSAGGELWVRAHVSGGEVFDVYDHSGTHLRTIHNTLPINRWVPPVVEGDDVWAVVTDDLDVQYVVRARVVPVGGR